MMLKPCTTQRIPGGKFVNVPACVIWCAPLLVKELKRLNPAGWSRKTKKEVA